MPARKTAATIEVPETAVTVLPNTYDLPAWDIPTEPSWERAKDLCQEVRRTAVTIVLLGQEIKGLYDQWFSQGARNDLRRENQVTRQQTTGWQQRVQEELGISHQTAERLMEKAQYVCMLQQLFQGEVVEYVDSRDKEVTIEPTHEIRELAGDMLSNVVSGTVNAKRGWAGVVGEGTRRTKGGGTGRAPVDHVKNLKDAVRKLKTSLKEWKTLDPDERAEIEQEWLDMRDVLPDTWMY